MTLAPTEVPSPGAAPDHVEVLIREARRRGRRHRMAFASLLVALVAGATAAVVIGPGGNAGSPSKTHERQTVNPVATAADWATARRTCGHRGLDAMRSFTGVPHLYGAYPTDVRLAINWPQQIYPITRPPSPTTSTPGSTSQSPTRGEGWPRGTNSSNSAQICIFTGHFASVVYGAGSHTIEHSRVVLVYIMNVPFPPLKGPWVSITATNTIPTRPVPVAG